MRYIINDDDLEDWYIRLSKEEPDLDYVLHEIGATIDSKNIKLRKLLDTQVERINHGNTGRTLWE